MRPLPRYRHLVVTTLLLLGLAPTVSAQREAWNWYFGHRAGVTFSSGTAQSLSDGRLSTNEGCATQSDPVTGDLLFYTDGVTVWNRMHDVMPGGEGLYGDASTSQSALIVPVPGNSSLYYIFNPAPITSSAIGSRCFCLYYSVVDMRKQGSFGEVVRWNQLLTTDITEHLTATIDCRGDSYWIVVRSRTFRQFLSFRLTRDGLQTTPVISDAGNPNLPVRDAGQMHISPNSRHLVITSAAGNSQLYDFNTITGKVLNAIDLFPTSTAGSHYGAAFSRDSRKLYISVSNRGDTIPTVVYQFNTAAGDASDIQNSRKLAFTLPNVTTWTSLQLGPDGRIYATRPGEPYLAVIERPGRNVDSIRFRDSAVILTGQCRVGLPNVIGSMLVPPNPIQAGCNAPIASFTGDTTCANTCLGFMDESVGNVDTWEWYFDGGTPASSILKNPSRICYAQPGLYPVRLVVSNRFGSDTTYRLVRIQPPPSISTDSVADLCPGTSVRLGVSGAETYEWSPRESLDDPASPTPLARPKRTTHYIVVGRNAYGCADTASVTVRVLDVGAGPDVTICRGGNARLAAHGATSYVWTPAEGLDDPTSPTPVASPTISTNYVVRLITPTCEISDTVRVNVVDTFRVAISGAPTMCAGQAAPLSVSGGGSSFRWTPEEGLDDPTSPTPTVRPLRTTTYRVTALSGSCRAEAEITITVLDPPIVDAGKNAVICAGDTAALNATTTATSVLWQPVTGLSDPTSLTPKATPTRTTTYYLRATSANNCVAVDSVTVIVRSSVSINAGTDKSICAGQAVQLTAFGEPATYSWSPTTGLSDPTILSPIARPSVTTMYVLTARSGSCMAMDTVMVFVSSLNLTVTPDTTICANDGIRLRAEGATKYVWTPSDGLSDHTIGNPIASPTTTTTYIVQGTDQYGCTDTRSVTVSVRPHTPITLRLGTVTAEAGSINAGIPIFIDVDPSQLGMTIDTLRAEIHNNIDIFKPESTDRGKIVPGFRLDDGIRITYLEIANVVLLAPRQKLTEIRGIVLLGKDDTTPFTWADILVKGITCPEITSTPGMLFVSGCNIRGRALKRFMDATLSIQTSVERQAIDLEIGGTMPGTYGLRLVSTEGRTLWENDFERPFDDALPRHRSIDMSAIGTGLYYVVFHRPTGTDASPILYMP